MQKYIYSTVYSGRANIRCVTIHTLRAIIMIHISLTLFYSIFALRLSICLFIVLLEIRTKHAITIIINKLRTYIIVLFKEANNLVRVRLIG